MSSGDTYCGAVVGHDLTKELSACEHGNAKLYAAVILRIVRVNCGGVYSSIDCTVDVISTLSDKDSAAGCCKLSCEHRLLIVRTGYGKIL